MRGGRILWGQIAVVFTIVVVMTWAATQWTAWRLGFQGQLGNPWFELAGWPIYYPPALFWWWYAFDAYAPSIFVEGGAIAASGGILAIVAAITMSIIRAREARNVATYGSARWAEDKEIRDAGLLGPDGVLLGKHDREYLRHDGPEHVLCFAPTRSGKGVGLVVPTLLTWPGSCIVHDIKGENWTLTAGFRAKHGRVLLFDPTNTKSSAYNPLLEVRQGEWEVRDVQNIADILVDPEGSLDKRNHWEKKRHRVRVPETPVYLDALLTDEPLMGGLEPRLGGQHLRVLTIIGFPTATTPGLLDELNRLAFPYRWSTRAILLDKTDATKLLTKIRRQWFAKRKSIAAILKEVMTNEASALVDTDAANKAADADMALQELGADLAGMAYVTATITIWDADPRIADEKLRLAEKVVQGRDFTAMVETVNAVDAWLGSLPGHAYANVRQPPISTLNLAHMMPLSALWPGSERDEHFGAPPLLYAKTEGSTPFRLSLHVGDVGHTLVVGPTGAGKSVLLALMALQFRRYARSQVFAFDFGGSIRAASLAMGGDWHDLGGGLTEGSDASVSLQPLARIHDTYERAWAADWIVAILMREGVAITPEAKEHIWTALTSLASAPVEERTITGLAVLLQSNDLKQALRPYCVGGAYGRLLDAEAEHLGSSDVQAFEIEGLVGTGAAGPVLAYLFHRIGDRLDGRPTLLIIDEGWLALDDEGFAGQLREWLKTLRKKNASVIFATQSLSDIDGSNIAPAIIESCPTRLLLPNERAIEPQITAIYRRFGLNDRQIEILARATPKRDYYCQSRRGNRLFELGLSEIGLALCAASSKSDQTLIAQIVAEHGRDGFLAAWLAARDAAWAVDLLPTFPTLIPQTEKEFHP